MTHFALFLYHFHFLGPWKLCTVEGHLRLDRDHPMVKLSKELDRTYIPLSMRWREVEWSDLKVPKIRFINILNGVVFRSWYKLGSIIFSISIRHTYLQSNFKWWHKTNTSGKTFSKDVKDSHGLSLIFKHVESGTRWYVTFIGKPQSCVLFLIT